MNARDDDLARATARLLRRRGAGATPDGAHPLWAAEVFGLDRSAAFASAGDATRNAVLARCAGAMLEESWRVECSGIAFCARMTLASEVLAERQMYALIGADESAHCAWLQPWCDPREDAADAFTAFLDDCVGSGTPQPLAYLLQVVLEGFGVVHYARLARTCRDAGLAATFARMAEDEALHYAGGLAAFRADRLSGAEQRFLVDAAYTFLQMIRCGPQAVARALDREAGLDGPGQLIATFSALDADGATMAKLARMRSLMAQPGMDWLLERLDSLHAFTPCSASEAASVYTSLR